MTEQIRISATNLGQIALPDFCPRCFWIQLRLQFKLPFQIFPGIFNSIDSYTKRVVHGWFDRHAEPPSWLSNLVDIRTYRPPPHHSKFQVLDQETLVLLTGSPDGVLVRTDGSHMIIDYKTARFTGTQDELFPKYEAQLNAYAYIGEQCDLSPVSSLALIYMEPVTDALAGADDGNVTRAGFLMAFAAKVLLVDLDLPKIPVLMRKTREIYDQDRPPEGRDGCKDCMLLEQLMAVATR